MSGRSVGPAIVVLAAAAYTGQLCAADLKVQVRDANGAAIENAVIVLDPLDGPAAPTHAVAVMDQVKQRFVPRVLVVRTGTAVAFPNSDQVRHQVYSFSPPKVFNIKLYSGSPAAAIPFDKPGLVVLGCNIHDTMVGFIAVVDTPYFGKSPATGDFQISVPNGRYRVRVWHENLTTMFQAQTLDVTDGMAPLSLSLDVSASHTTLAQWPAGSP